MLRDDYEIALIRIKELQEQAKLEMLARLQQEEIRPKRRSVWKVITAIFMK